MDKKKNTGVVKRKKRRKQSELPKIKKGIVLAREWINGVSNR